MKKHPIYKELNERILVLDGGLGTMVQTCGLTEEEFRGAEFRDSAFALKGCNDVLALTAPHVIAEIHEAYLAAGADIVSTDTFNANAVSLADYGLSREARRINREAARLARGAADRFTAANPARPRFAAGSIGPTNKMASMPSDFIDLSARAVTFDELAAAYTEQVSGLIEGGADLLILETVFDTLNARAALYAIEGVFGQTGKRLPVMISGTIGEGGRTLTAQTVEAFYVSLAHARPLTVGLNCGFGAAQLRPYVERLSAMAACRVSAHPNAGLPNAAGGYDETPAMFADEVEKYLQQGLLNIVGGCCGTTPAHTAELAARVGTYRPRPLPEPDRRMRLSGLEPLEIGGDPVRIGRTLDARVSPAFAELLRAGRFDETLTLAAEAVAEGAQILEVCVDADGVDGAAAMTRLLCTVTFDPGVARAPVLLVSRDWPTVEAGLKCLQGKSLVQGLSLRDGEEELLRRAEACRRYGAAVVVSPEDGNGPARTTDGVVDIVRRICGLLLNGGTSPEDICIDLSGFTDENDAPTETFAGIRRRLAETAPGAAVKTRMAILY